MSTFGPFSRRGQVNSEIPETTEITEKAVNKGITNSANKNKERQIQK